ncbi:response regulator, partial [bacterium]
MRRPDRPLRVLIVDDDPDDHILTASTLGESTRAEFVVEHASTPKEAREKMAEGDFDVCLLDYALGPIDGVQLFKEVAAEGYATPTILLSGHDSEDVADQVLDAGLADYLEKRSLDGPSLERAILYALERDAARREIVALNQSLEERVRERTHELESFCYSVSHDLRAPLRAINATSAILREDYGDDLPPAALLELQRQSEASSRLGQLIDDLLQFVRLGQTEAVRARFDMTALAHAIADELRIEATIQEGMTAVGDETLVRLLVMNLLDNAVKFCGKESPCVE